jgi:hypothetical protein
MRPPVRRFKLRLPFAPDSWPRSSRSHANQAFFRRHAAGATRRWAQPKRQAQVPEAVQQGMAAGQSGQAAGSYASGTHSPPLRAKPSAHPKSHRPFTHSTLGTKPELPPRGHGLNRKQVSRCSSLELTFPGECDRLVVSWPCLRCRSFQPKRSPTPEACHRWIAQRARKWCVTRARSARSSLARRTPIARGRTRVARSTSVSASPIVWSSPAGCGPLGV